MPLAAWWWRTVAVPFARFRRDARGLSPRGIKIMSSLRSARRLSLPCSRPSGSWLTVDPPLSSSAADATGAWLSAWTFVLAVCQHWFRSSCTDGTRSGVARNVEGMTESRWVSSGPVQRRSGTPWRVGRGLRASCGYARRQRPSMTAIMLTTAAVAWKQMAASLALAFLLWPTCIHDRSHDGPDDTPTFRARS